MSSILRTAAHMPAWPSRKLCPVKRCADLAPFGRALCAKHEAKIPADLGAALDEAMSAFVAAAEESDTAAAMRALERALMTERRIRLAIEAEEARDGGR